MGWILFKYLVGEQIRSTCTEYHLCNLEESYEARVSGLALHV